MSSYRIPWDAQVATDFRPDLEGDSDLDHEKSLDHV